MSEHNTSNAVSTPPPPRIPPPPRPREQSGRSVGRELGKGAFAGAVLGVIGTSTLFGVEPGASECLPCPPVELVWAVGGIASMVIGAFIALLASAQS